MTLTSTFRSRVKRAAVTSLAGTILLGGGVAANSRLRGLLEERAAEEGLAVRRPRPGLCTDNGAMIAAVGLTAVRAGLPPSSLDFSAQTGLPVTRIVI